MPTRYPREFRDDVIRIALDRGPEVTLAQIAKDFGIHVGTLDKWLREERVEAGQKPGMTVLRMLSYVSFVNGTSSSNKKWKCSVVLPLISRRRTCREKALPARERARQ